MSGNETSRFAGGIASGSPRIDAGDNTSAPPGVNSEECGNPRVVDDPAAPDRGNGGPPIVDMGAYAFQGLCDPRDMNCDGPVDASDVEVTDILFNGATPCGACTGDTNGDG